MFPHSLRPSLIAGLGLVVGTTAFAYAPHPTMLTVKYKDQMLPVAHMVDTDPVVLVDGKEKRIRTEPTYLLQPASGYGHAAVHLSKISLAGMELKEVYDRDESVVSPSNGPRFGVTYFSCTMTSAQPLQGGFAAVMIYSPGMFAGAPGHFNGEVIVHQLPDLPAGRATEVKFSAAIPDGAPGLTYFIQVFDHEGHEVRTNAMSNAWAYYRLRELVTLKEARENYVRQNQGANHQLVPVLMPKPLLPEGDDRRPTAGSAVLDVDADGMVTAVELEGVDSPAYSDAISEAMGGWLFLPQLHAGTPVATRVKVPLAF